MHPPTLDPHPLRSQTSHMEIPAASAMAIRAGAAESPASSRGGWWALALLLVGLLVTALLFHFERGEAEMARANARNKATRLKKES